MVLSEGWKDGSRDESADISKKRLGKPDKIAIEVMVSPTVDIMSLSTSLAASPRQTIRMLEYAIFSNWSGFLICRHRS